MRSFLENYLTYTPTTMEQKLGRHLEHDDPQFGTVTLNQLRDQDIVSKVQERPDHLDIQARSLESVKGQPWTYVAFALKRCTASTNKIESTDRLVARYNVRLLQTERTERVPSGLMVAEYGESRMVGEKTTASCSRAY